MDMQVHQQVGKHDEAIETLKDEMKLVREELTAIRLLLAQQRGGWKVLVGLLTVSSTVGGALVWFFTHFKWGGP